MPMFNGQATSTLVLVALLKLRLPLSATWNGHPRLLWQNSLLLPRRLIIPTSPQLRFSSTIGEQIAPLGSESGQHNYQQPRCNLQTNSAEVGTLGGFGH
jgi:hypothetical protein